MSDKDQAAIVIMGLVLFLFWKRETVTTTFYQTCTFPDGTEVQVPLGDPCPYDPEHGGQSEVLEA